MVDLGTTSGGADRGTVGVVDRGTGGAIIGVVDRGTVGVLDLGGVNEGWETAVTFGRGLFLFPGDRRSLNATGALAEEGILGAGEARVRGVDTLD